MRLQLDTCAMPSCKAYTERGKRLCEKHAAAGKDLRIPKFVLETGLTKIYNAIQQQKHGFSVESTMRILDQDYAEHSNVINNINAMAKLFRALRANGYIVKKGHRDGFVIYHMGTGWDRSNVTIEDDDEPKQESQKQTLHIQHIEQALHNITSRLTQLEQRLAETKAASNKNELEQLYKRLEQLEDRTTQNQKIITSLKDEITCLHKKNLELCQQLDTINNKPCDCPVAKLRDQMHVLFGGKKTDLIKR